jgi:hypothetical protein
MGSDTNVEPVPPLRASQLQELRFDSKLGDEFFSFTTSFSLCKYGLDMSIVEYLTEIARHSIRSGI